MGVDRRCRDGVNGLLHGDARAHTAEGRLWAWSRSGERAGSSHGRGRPSTGTSSWGQSGGGRTGAQGWHGFRDVTGKPGTVAHDESQLFPKAAVRLKREEKICECEIEGPSAGPRTLPERHTCVPGREAAPGAPLDHRSGCFRRGRDDCVVRLSGVDCSRPAMGPHLQLGTS